MANDSGTLSRRREEGTILIWALMVVMLTSGMVISHSTYMAAARATRETRFSRDTLASAFARSGVTDTVGWFRRQTTQPVQSFLPLLDPTGNPPIHDTIDPTVGLVREFEIQGNLRGRYEVRTAEASDISPQRGLTIPGSVWQIGVRSYVYRAIDPTVPYDQPPNRMISVDTMTTEIRNAQLNLPAQTPLMLDEVGDLNIGFNTTVDGSGEAAIAYKQPLVMTVSTIDAGATIIGAELAMPSYDASALTVFSMSMHELRAFADMVVRVGTSDIPLDDSNKKVIKDAIVVVAGDELTADPIYVENSLVVYDGSMVRTGLAETQIQGVLYVNGDVKIDAPFVLRGAMVVRGEVRIGESGRVAIHGDRHVVARVRQNLNRYRERRTRVPLDAP